MFEQLKHKKESEKTILTGAHRCSFPSVFEKKEPSAEYPNAKAKYEITLLVKKGDPMLKTLMGMITEVMNAKYGSKDKWPDMWYNPVKDGDKSNLEKYPEQEGHYVVKLSNTRDEPKVVGPDKKVILDAREIYPGCWVQCRFDVYSWGPGKHGVGLGLRVVRKVADDNPFGGAAAKETVDDLPDLDLPEVGNGGSDNPFADFE